MTFLFAKVKIFFCFSWGMKALMPTILAGKGLKQKFRSSRLAWLKNILAWPWAGKNRLDPPLFFRVLNFGAIIV